MAQCTAVRILARQVSLLLTGSCLRGDALNVLGIWDGHDSGAALLQDGRLSFAVNEERLSRRKLEVRFPIRSIDACLAHAGLSANAIDLIAASTFDPAKTLGRWWPGSKERYYAIRRRISAPGALAGLTRAAKYRMTEWPPLSVTKSLSRVALRRQLVECGLGASEIVLVDHHQAHAATAAFGSGFAPCAVLTIDGVGDGLSSSISVFRDGRLTRVAASPARASLGVFFEHVTNLLNMRELEDEGKVMALADYAAPIADEKNPLLGFLRVRDGVIESTLNSRALRAALSAVHWGCANEQFAYLAQRVVENICVALARDAVRLTGCRRLALAGGVVSNVKATRRVRILAEVDDLYVFPHMGDGGLAVGAALLAASEKNERIDLDLGQLGLGPGYDVTEIEAALRNAGFAPQAVPNLVCRVAELLSDGRVVMWFQGRMEYGPRALGHRSVLARPDLPRLRDRLNLVLKRRVWYQPFCPSMLESEAPKVLSDWTGGRNRSMTMAYQVSEEFRERLAGVTSIDGTLSSAVRGGDGGQ